MPASVAPPHAVQLLRSPEWAGLSRIEHAVSERAGGLSGGPFAGLNLGLHVGDDPTAVVANREQLAAALSTPLDRFVFADQVHGCQVAVITGSDAGRGSRDLVSAIPATDALVSNRPGLWLAIQVADCVPLLLADPVRGVVGAAHAGWRGTVAGIASATVGAMAEEFGSRREDILALIGPSVGPGDYEVDEPVLQAVRTAFPGQWQELVTPARPGHAWLDLWAANRQQLIGAGVPGEHITVAGISTPRSTDRFYSVRGEGAVTGRFGAFVRLA
jgi:YfiH family protein